MLLGYAQLSLNDLSTAWNCMLQWEIEVLTSQNYPRIRLQKVPRYVEGAEKVPLLEVGLNLEILTNQGAGFFVVMTLDGVVPPNMIEK